MSSRIRRRTPSVRWETWPCIAVFYQFDCTLRLFDNLSRVFVIAKRDKFGMTKPVCLGRFQKLDNGYYFGFDPYAFLHLLGVQNLAPSGASGLWQIHERALISDQWLQLLVNHPAGRWH